MRGAVPQALPGAELPGAAVHRHPDAFRSPELFRFDPKAMKTYDLYNYAQD